MKVLVACEESQAVCKAFREKGHEAYSCDVVESSGGRPEWHILDDVLDYLHDGWDMIVAFPPCTHLCSSGARWFAQKRADGRQQQGIDFFMRFVGLDCCSKVAIENPVGIMSRVYRKPDQIIQPWQFGHPESKATCLWLKGLPPLKPTIICDPIWHDNKTTKGKKTALNHNKPQIRWDDRIHKMPQTKNRAKLRSKTYSGIALAMAKQWS
jgi:hypothetical protein